MQQEQGVDDAILNPISIIQQRRGGGGQQHAQHRLVIDGAENVYRQSVQYLADFLNGDGHEVTELQINESDLARPSDGGLDVLCDLFANNTTLTKVKLDWCNFGSTEEASHLLAAFETNRTVMDLAIRGIRNLLGTALGNCISGLLLNMPQLQRLELGWLDAETVRALQPGLQTNCHLKTFDLSYCQMRDEGLRLIVDALVGNTTMEVFDCSGNYNITSYGLADITRLVEFTRLKKICAKDIDHLFADKNAVQHFISVLRHRTSLEEFQSGIDSHHFPEPEHRATIITINNILTRNVNIRRAKELLALQPRTGLPIGSKSGIWYMAMAKMAEQGFDKKQFQRDDKEDDEADDNDININIMNDSNDKSSSGVEHVSGENDKSSSGVEHVSGENEVVENYDGDDDDDDDMNGSDSHATPVGEEGSALQDEVQSDDSDDDDADDHDDSDNGPDARTPTYPGASAIFKIFQTRPAIIEKQLRRPAATAALQEPQDSATTKQHDAQEPKSRKNGGGGDSSSGANDESNSSLQSDGRKRQRTL